MKRFLIALAILASACGSNAPSAPTVTTSTTTTIPAPIAQSHFQYGDGNLVCERGFCFSFTMMLTNIGPGCATNVNAIVSWFGSDGAIPLPNTPSIQMGAPGGLTTYLFRPGQSLLLTSTTGFNDVRSAHTIYRASATWTDVRC